MTTTDTSTLHVPTLDTALRVVCGQIAHVFISASAETGPDVAWPVDLDCVALALLALYPSEGSELASEVASLLTPSYARTCAEYGAAWNALAAEHATTR
ncbi:MAG: hypothetical protein A2Y78_08450 [Acidobacteria bacterium RBG_13_68_16]|nr:MAG: hypothetical protein A2Y78_08450 [Acidobacteria bacterium RBG_13_68_16]